MGFFKDFRDDLSQAVNELLPEEESTDEDKEAAEDTQEQLVNTLDSDETTADEAVDNEMMKEWLEVFAQEEDNTADDTADKEEKTDLYSEEEDTDQLETDELNEALEEALEEEAEEEAEQDLEEESEQNLEEELELKLEEEEVKDMDDNVDLELLEAMNAEAEDEKEEVNEKTAPKLRATSFDDSDEVTVITKGTSINGSISSDGSLDIMGSITGDVECLGKLSITGKIIGNSSAAEVYVNTERLEGSITSEGSVKIGLGTVVIGDITATSGVIAGAVKGEIDINGPIVIDSTAIIKGNIKAKSVQVNNGAVVEGFCSLSYSSVDVDNIFE